MIRKPFDVRKVGDGQGEEITGAFLTSRRKGEAPVKF